MNMIGWTRRSSNAGPFRASNSHYAMNEGGMRHSRSVERQSRIPLRSSSSQAANRCQPVGFQHGRERSKSQVAGTPLNTGKMTPQSNFGSRVTPNFSSSSTLQKVNYTKDNRNLHDKEYIKEAAHIVQIFFQERCPEMIVNGTDIKPMTIKMFIGMVNYLFATLEIVDKRQEPVVFEVSTYEKELPYWMKKLMYPGLINKAWLQTVNVPNNWHHVIGLLSWLVKICQISELYNFEEQLQTDNLSKTWKFYYFKQSLKAYRLFTEGKEDEYRELSKEVVQKFYELNNVDERENLKLQQEIEEKLNNFEDNIEAKELIDQCEILFNVPIILRINIERGRYTNFNKLQQKLENPNVLAEKDELDEAVQKLKNMELLSDKLTDDIAKKEDDVELYKARVLEKERNCDILKKTVVEKKKELEHLKNVVSKQPTSMSEIVELRKKSEYLDKEIKFLEKEFEDLSQLNARYEFEAAEKRDAILQATHAFNRSIIQLEQIVPELKEFRIYKDPEDKEIISEMESTAAALSDLKVRKMQLLEELEMQIKKKEEEIEDKVQALKNLTEVIAKLEELKGVKKRKNLTLQTEFEEKEQLVKGESEKWNEKLRIIEEKMKEFNELKEKQEKLEIRHGELARMLAKTEKLSEEFWTKVVEKWKDVPEKLETLVKLVKEQNVDLKNGYSQLLTAIQPK